MSLRRYYVSAPGGEIGPHNRLELRELLRSGLITEDDRLRSPAGTLAGTVGELLSHSEESSSYRLIAAHGAGPRPVRPAGRRPSQPLAVATRATADGRRPFPMQTVILATTLLILLVGWWLLSQRERERRNLEQVFEAAQPVLSLTGSDGSWVLGQPASVAVHADRVLEKSLTVRLALSGTAIPGIDFTGLPGEVDIPAGQDFVRLSCLPMVVTNARRPAVEIGVGIQPGPGYQVRGGANGHALITLATDEKLAGGGTGAGVQWLDALPFLDEWSCGSAVGRNVSHLGNRLVIDKVSYPNGLSMHPGNARAESVAHVTVALDGRMDEFLADIGIDDAMDAHPEAAAIFQVWVDNMPQFDSGVIRAVDPIRAVRINIAGCKTLRLVVRMAGTTNLWAHADWGGARLIRH